MVCIYRPCPKIEGTGLSRQRIVLGNCVIKRSFFQRYWNPFMFRLKMRQSSETRPPCPRDEETVNTNVSPPGNRMLYWRRVVQTNTVPVRLLNSNGLLYLSRPWAQSKPRSMQLKPSSYTSKARRAYPTPWHVFIHILFLPDSSHAVSIPIFL